MDDGGRRVQTSNTSTSEGAPIAAVRLTGPDAFQAARLHANLAILPAGQAAGIRQKQERRLKTAAQDQGGLHDDLTP